MDPIHRNYDIDPQIPKPKPWIRIQTLKQRFQTVSQEQDDPISKQKPKTQNSPLKA